jgi:hypothetical protein
VPQDDEPGRRPEALGEDDLGRAVVVDVGDHRILPHGAGHVVRVLEEGLAGAAVQDPERGLVCVEELVGAVRVKVEGGAGRHAADVGGWDGPTLGEVQVVHAQLGGRGRDDLGDAVAVEVRHTRRGVRLAGPDPREALAGFASVIELEKEQGEWCVRAALH